MSNPKAQAAKDKGNAAFRAGDYPLAIGHYTSALMADPRGDPAYALNRAAAYLRLGKNEDAERDCTRVLDIHKNNVKALFRRGQARVGLGKLLEAQNDFSEVLRIEPANASARDEQTKLSKLIQEEKAKKARMPAALGTPTSTAPANAIGADAAPAPKRRRVPIRIIDPSSSTSTSMAASASASASSPAPTPTVVSSAPPAPTKPQPLPVTTPPPHQATPRPKSKAAAPPPTVATTTATLEAVSSRSLKSTASAPAPTSAAAPDPSQIPPALAAAAAALKPVVSEKGKETGSTTPTLASTPTSFKDAKQARASAKPSRVGGGIFRSSGDNTIFERRGTGGEEGKSATSASSCGNNTKTDTMKAKMDTATPAADALSSLITNGITDTTENTDMAEKMKVDAEPSASEILSSLIHTGSTDPDANANTATTHMTKSVAKKENGQVKYKRPTTLFEFAKTWNGLKTVGEKWGYINTIPPTDLPKLCQTSLDPTLLGSLLDVFLAVLTTDTVSDSLDTRKATVRAYMENLARTPRFSTLVLMLSGWEKGVGKKVWEGIGGVGAGDGGSVRKAWAGVGI